MESTNRRVLIAIGVVVLIACLCLCLIGLIAGGYFWTFIAKGTEMPIPTAVQQGFAIPTQPTPINPEPTSSMIEPTSQPGPTETSAITPPSSGDNLPAEVSSQMDKIQEQVIQLRGLTSTGPVPRSLITQE